MHYAVPALLARAGMLERFYTDICADFGLARRLGAVWPALLRPKAVVRLFGRRLPSDVPPDAVRQVPVHALIHYALRHLPGIGSCVSEFAVEHRMMDLVRRDAFAGADALYTVLVNSDLELMREARARGIKVVHEVMIGPDVDRWVEEERARFPGLERSMDPRIISVQNGRDAAKYQLANLILVPSDFVRRAVLDFGADPDRIATVPYGLDETWLHNVGDPVPGRALFVGSVGLRKGNHYLAEASRILKRRRVPCEVRVVGPYGPAAVSRPEFAGPNYVGQVPRSRVIEEFRRADLLVLPTLCDSFALVHLEAMACGVPVITTPNCGSVVRDGLDGFIVPIRDADAIAEKIELLITDRSLRERMGRSARERAREFTWMRYGERLLQAVSRLSR